MSENSEALTETPEGITFSDLGLSEPLLNAVTDSGYTIPTPIQWRAIPEVLKGRDVLGIAQTGTGKTASFVLPMIEILAQGRAKARMPRTIILEPTRELAAQVAENFEKYGKNHKLNMALLIGGVSFGDQDALLMKGVDILIATPGRLLDQFERGKILLSGVQLLVIDEADRMLDMGFIPDIERLVKLTPFTRQTLFFSATMPKEISGLADQFLQAPVRIEVARPAQTASTIEQFLIRAKYNDFKAKRNILRNIISNEGDAVKNAVVFCNRKKDVDIVAKSLCAHGFDAAPIHGDLDQNQRTITLDKFRAGELKFLVASDVAARGLDVPDLSHVFNFDVPMHADDYVHRIGRTGRAGKLGRAFMITTPYDSKNLTGVENLIGGPIPLFESEIGQNDEPVADERRERRPKKSFKDRKPRPEQVADETSDGIEQVKPKDKRPQKTNNREFKNELNDADVSTASKIKPERDNKNYRKPHYEDYEMVKGFGDFVPSFINIDPYVNHKLMDPSAEEVVNLNSDETIVKEQTEAKPKPKRIRKPRSAKTNTPEEVIAPEIVSEIPNTETEEAIVKKPRRPRKKIIDVAIEENND